MPNSFSFSLHAKKSHARAGSFTTPHGTVQTPMFMPVGTQATVKAMSPGDLNHSKAQIILANTYHLYLRPGEEIIHTQGGVQKFMNWHKPMLTDSGGFQVFSLGKQMEAKFEKGMSDKKGVLARASAKTFSKITDDGVEFVSHLDGSKHMFTPEKAIEIQRNIGADIIMAFDECTPDDASPAYTQEALNRTHAWARRCVSYWQAHKKMSAQGSYQALFGIIQGAMHKELRQASAQEIASLGFDGIAFGGETIGYNMKGTVEVMDWVRSLIPEDKPRSAMGLGRDPQDILDAVRAGYDMFDCVAPTRLARNGAVYAGKLDLSSDDPDRWVFNSPYTKGRMQIGNAQWMHDSTPIQENCDCYTCSQGFSKAYLNHLYRSEELLYYRLASIHNVRFMIRMCEQLREAIVG